MVESRVPDPESQVPFPARGVIFDMDGVLVDSGPAHYESWRLMARRHGLDIDEARFKATFGRTSTEIIQILWPGLPAAEVQRRDAEKEAVYRDLIRGRVPLMPGCVETLAALRAAGRRIAIGTSGPPENIELVLSEGGLASYFEAVVHRGMIARGKPAPDCFLLAAERLGLPPAACVVIEDAPAGVQAGCAAGMTVIALASNYPPAQLQTAGATHVVSHLTDVPPLVIDYAG
jgi:HAD superfamily hydrolase (TIGR01509 family)